MSPTIKVIFYGIFLVSAVLRLSLCFVNRQANDDHFEVVSLILAENRYPARHECFQCYQPKFYHFLTAKAITLLGIKTTGMRIVTGQLLNGIAGIATVLLAFFLIIGLPGTAYLPKLFAFALLALNPGLIAINGQLTNDSFVILFGTLSIFLAALFAKTGNLRLLILMALAGIAAGISKGNGHAVVIILLAVLTASLCELWTNHREKGLSSPLLRHMFLTRVAIIVFFIPLYLFLVPKLGGTTNDSNYPDTSIPIQPVAGPLHLFKENVMSNEWPLRPGVTSIVAGYGTFRFIDLLRHPMMLWWEKTYPRHRTSLWTQLYGRAFFAHFDCWPQSWIMTNWYVPLLGRAIFVLSLIPIIFFILGSFLYGRQLARAIACRGFLHHLASFEWVLPLGAAVYFAFIITYTWLYRDYSTMKPIFMYPAIICFMKLLYEGMVFCEKKSRKAFNFAVYPILTGLLSLYTVDIMLLIKHLHSF